MLRTTRLVTVAAMLIGLVACSHDSNSNRPSGIIAQKKVIFIYPIKIDALEAVERGVREELGQERFGFGVESAEGNSELFQPTVRAAIRQKPDLLVLIGTQISQAALALEHELALPPLVFTAVTRPADVLPPDQLSTPRQENITGMTDTPSDLADATLELARRLKPGLRKIGILYTPSEANSVSSTNSIRDGAKAHGVEIALTTTESGPAAATSALLAQDVDLILIPKDKIATGNVPTIVETALRQAREGKTKQPTPVIAMDSGSVEEAQNGAVAAASARYYDIGRATGVLARRILSGEPANTIPITGPDKSRTYVNLTSASTFCLDGLKGIFPDAVFSGTENPSLCAGRR